MNSGELKVDVPLADGESDIEEESGATNKGQQKKEDPMPKITMDGGDSISGSLEDLVNSFDEKLTSCFKDYQEQVEKIAPVQVRSQEEIMNECQVWWTITGNFGNMMPIDWSKSTARAKHISALNLPAPRPPKGAKNLSSTVDELEEEDDIVAADLDMHSLILTSNPQENVEPVKSADEVIKEIDEIIDAADDDQEDQETTEQPKASQNLLPNLPLTSRRVLSQALRGRNLEDLTVNELTQILSDIELLVRELSEELVSDLGVRDELEYEKELKNTFISLLLSIQSRRRACGSDQTSSGSRGKGGRTRDGQGAASQPPAQPNYKYLTTVIPYQPEKGSPSLHGLQVLVKILKAINEDSPAVPALLTDYILKVLCPS